MAGSGWGSVLNSRAKARFQQRRFFAGLKSGPCCARASPETRGDASCVQGLLTRRCQGEALAACGHFLGVLGVLKAERIAGGASDAARVVVEEIIQDGLCLPGILVPSGYGYGTRVWKGSGATVSPWSGVEVHVLREAVGGVEEVVAGPAFGGDSGRLVGSKSMETSSPEP